MSFEVITYEKLKIKDLSKCKRFKDELVDYWKNLIDKFDSIYMIDFKIGTEHIKLNEKNIEPGCIDKFLIKIEEFNELELIASYNVEVIGLAKAGFNFYRDFFNDEVKDIINYKVLEYYDVDSEVVAYRFGKENGEYYDGDVPLVKGIKDVNEITEWYCYNFIIELEIKLINTNEQKKLQTMLASLKDLIYTEYGDDEFEIDEDGLINYSAGWSLHEFSIHKFDKLIELINNLKKYVDEKDGDFNLEAEFTPERERAFAKIAIMKDENNYNLFSCSF